MLVTRTPKRRRGGDQGSSLVSVLVVMLVLSLTSLTLAAVVTNTTRTLASSRGTFQARAAADAGLAAALAAYKRNGGCGSGSITSTTDALYEATCSVSGSNVTFRSTGHGTGTASSTVEAVYLIHAAASGPGGDHMVFFGDATFTYETRALSAGLLNITIPRGDFTCMAVIPANLTIAGGFSSKGSCDVKGSVHAGGNLNAAVDTDRIRGDATSSATTGTNGYAGIVDGDVAVGSALELSWQNRLSVGGDLTSSGNVKLRASRVGGAVKVPITRSLTYQLVVELPILAGINPRGGGTVTRPATVAAPAAPTFDPWHDYAYKAGDWTGYSYKKLTTAECKAFNDWPADSWNTLGSYTNPTVLDGSACPSLESGSGAEKSSTLQANLVLIAPRFDLQRLTLKPAAGKSPTVWFVVPDSTDDNNPDSKPNCGGARGIVLNQVNITVPSMAYTPGCIDVTGGGTWTGSLYGGKFEYGGAIDMNGVSIPLPGVTSAGSGGSSSTSTLELVSQREVG